LESTCYTERGNIRLIIEGDADQTTHGLIDFVDYSVLGCDFYEMDLWMETKWDYIKRCVSFFTTSGS